MTTPHPYCAMPCCRQSESGSEFIDLVELNWAQTRIGYVLHAVRSFEGDDDLVPVGGNGMTFCGIRSRLGIPGALSRLGAWRCHRCCIATDYPDGMGSPKNSDAIRAIAEARIPGWRQQGGGFVWEPPS